jgi:hypothetical protein
MLLIHLSIQMTPSRLSSNSILWMTIALITFLNYIGIFDTQFLSPLTVCRLFRGPCLSVFQVTEHCSEHWRFSVKMSELVEYSSHKSTNPLIRARSRTHLLFPALNSDLTSTLGKVMITPVPRGGEASIIFKSLSCDFSELPSILGP